MTSPDSNKVTPLQEVLFTCKTMLKYVLLFGGFINVLMLATPMYSMQVLDRVIGSGNLHTLMMLSIIVAFALAAMAFLQGARQFAIVRMGAWFERQLSEKVFSATVRNAVNLNRSVGSQNISDLQVVKNFLVNPCTGHSVRHSLGYCIYHSIVFHSSLLSLPCLL